MEPMFVMCVDHNENIAAIDAGIICISWRRGRITAFGKNPVFRIIESGFGSMCGIKIYVHFIV